MKINRSQSQSQSPSSRRDNNSDEDDRVCNALPTAGNSDVSFYHGAYVFEPVPGIHHNVVYPDLASLYPNTMRTLNTGIRTKVGTQDELEKSQWSEEDCLWGYVDPREVIRLDNDENWQQYRDPDQYKAIRQRDSNGNLKTKWTADPIYERLYFLHPSIREGEIASSVDDAIALKDQYRGTSMYEAIKRITNSFYGYIGYSTDHGQSRLFDHQIAEAITLVGRKVIQYTANVFAQFCREELGLDVTIIGGDTDSAMASFPKDLDRDEVLEYAMDAARYLNEVAYDDLAREEFGVQRRNHHFEVEIESYSPKAYLHDSKKRYATHVTWDEDDGEVDWLNVKGFAMQRSDVSDLTIEVQLKLFETILRDADSVADARRLYADYLIETLRTLEERPLDDVGVRGGIKKELEEYGTPSRVPQPIYRGAKYAREHIDGEEDLGGGSKPFAFPIERLCDDQLPSTYNADTGEDGNRVDYIAVENPDRLEDIVDIDYETIRQKQIRERIEPIFENIGWEYEAMAVGQRQTSVTSFM